MKANVETGETQRGSPRNWESFALAALLIVPPVGGPGMVGCNERASMRAKVDRLLGSTNGMSLPEVIAEYGPPDDQSTTPQSWTWFDQQPILPRETRQLAIYYLDYGGTIVVLFIDGNRTVIGSTTL